jgi:hypothetical protein
MWCTLLCVIITFVALKLLEKLSRWAWIGDWFTKYVLITGCDTGFGRLTAVALDKQGTGCHVIACEYRFYPLTAEVFLVVT